MKGNHGSIHYSRKRDFEAGGGVGKGRNGNYFDVAAVKERWSRFIRKFGQQFPSNTIFCSSSVELPAVKRTMNARVINCLPHSDVAINYKPVTVEII